MKRINVLISILITIIFISTTIAPVFAEESIIKNVEPEDKISEELKNIIDNANHDDRFPVSIWYKDINQSIIEEQTINKLSLSSNARSAGSDFSSLKYDNKDVVREETNNFENNALLADDYKMAHREISSTLYSIESNRITTSLNLDDNNIIFRSSYTPLIIANLSAAEIERYSCNESIESLYAYQPYDLEDQTDLYRDSQLPSDAMLAQKSLGLDKVFEKYDLDGEGIKIGFSEGSVTGIAKNEQGEPDEEYTYSNYHFHTSNILNVTYDPATQLSQINDIVENRISNADDPEAIKIINIVENDNASFLSPTAHHGHANITPKVIIGENYGIAPKATIYSTLVGRGNIPQEQYQEHANMEALLRCGIDIYMMNIEVGVTYPVSSDFISSKTKYLDYLANNLDLTIVMPGGNFYKTNNNGEVTPTGRWISASALGYNVITVGGYSYQENNGHGVYIRKNYKWQNCDNENTFSCEKPDILGPAFYAGSGTSVATPSIVGVIALMMQLEPSLKSNPREVKAIILASCHKKAEISNDDVNETMTSGIPEREKTGSTSGISERQGAGIPNAWNITMIILQHTYGSGNINTSNDIHIIQPSYGATNITFSLCWFKKYSSQEEYPETDEISEQYIDDLSLSIYNNRHRICYSDLDYSSAELCNVLTEEIEDYSYWLHVNNNDHRTSQFAYAWSTDNMYNTLPSQNGVFFIRGNNTLNKSLENDITANESYLQPKMYNSNSLDVDEKQYEWIVRRYQGNGITLQSGYGYSGNHLGISSVSYSNSSLYADIASNESLINIKKNDAKGCVSLLSQDLSKIMRTNNLKVFWKNYYEGQTIPQLSEWYFDKANYYFFDANTDGAIDELDTEFVQRYDVGTGLANNIQQFLGDVNEDGNLDILDVTLIQRYLQGNQ